MSNHEEQHEHQEVDNEFLGNKEAPTAQGRASPHVEQQKKVEVKEVKEEKKQSINKIKKPEPKKQEKGVQDNPQYFRVDFQITHKLYEIYRRLKLVAADQVQSFSFQQKQQGNNTMNYHKIMQIFKDINFKLEINQKLQILRAIKKFCFNQNFINEEEFIKIFKVIVHGVGVKENVFRELIASKYASVVVEKEQKGNRRGISIKLNKNFGKKLKTEITMQGSKVKSPFTEMMQDQRSFQTVANADNSYLKNIPINPSVVVQDRLNPTRGSGVNTARKHESRRKMLTQANRYEPGEKGYLNRAIEKNKLGKLTWQNLFKMTEDNMHYNISIPSFVTQDINFNDLDI